MTMGQKPPRMVWWARFVPSTVRILTFAAIVSIALVFLAIRSAQAGVVWFPIVAGVTLLVVWGAIVEILLKAPRE